MYFVFAFAFFWLLLILEIVFITAVLGIEIASVPAWVFIASSIIGSWMPSLAAAIVTGVCEGRAAVGKLFGMFFKFGLPFRWYLAAIIPVGLTFAAVGVYSLFGGEASGAVNTSVTFWLMLVASNFFTGATGEEPGWRGFALPQLLQGNHPLKAGLLLGLMWGFWHLPLWLMEGKPAPELLLYVLAFMVFIISLNLLMTWVFLRTPHSLLPMVILHFAANFTHGLVTGGLGLGQETPLFYLTAGLTCVAALIVIVAGGFSRTAAVETLPVAV